MVATRFHPLRWNTCAQPMPRPDDAPVINTVFMPSIPEPESPDSIHETSAPQEALEIAREGMAMANFSSDVFANECINEYVLHGQVPPLACASTSTNRTRLPSR